METIKVRCVHHYLIIIPLKNNCYSVNLGPDYNGIVFLKEYDNGLFWGTINDHLPQALVDLTGSIIEGRGAYKPYVRIFKNQSE